MGDCAINSHIISHNVIHEYNSILWLYITDLPVMER